MKRFLLFIIFTFLIKPAFPSTFDAASNANGSGTAISVSHTIAAGANLVAIACVFSANGPATFSSVTYDSVTMTSHQRTADGPHVTECYKLVNPATGTKTFSATASTSTVWGVSVSSYSGVDQAAPAGTAVTDIGVNNNLASVVVTSVVGDIVHDALNVQQDGGESGALTVGASQTAMFNIELALNSFGSSREAGAASVTMSWTWTFGNQSLAHMAFNIKSATPAAPLFKRYYDLLRSSLLRKEGLSDLAFSEVRR